MMKLFDHHNRGQFIFARQVRAGQDVEVKEGSMLGGIPIDHYLEMPGMLAEDGRPDQTCLFFGLYHQKKISTGYFNKGQVVELVVPV